jgi:hypothetical protein
MGKLVLFLALTFGWDVFGSAGEILGSSTHNSLQHFSPGSMTTKVSTSDLYTSDAAKPTVSRYAVSTPESYLTNALICNIYSQSDAFHGSSALNFLNGDSSKENNNTVLQASGERLNSILSFGVFDNDEVDCYKNDEQAINFVDNELKLYDQVQNGPTLSEHEKAVLKDEIRCATADDYMLVFKMNPAWIAANDRAVADEIMDRVACFEMEGGRRRDEGVGGHRWIFHFNTMTDIQSCQSSIIKEFSRAFTLSQMAKSILGGPLPGHISPLPLGQTSVINKIGPCQNDAFYFQFFAV